MMKKKKCCILFNQPLEGALADELDVLEQAEHIEENLEKLGISVYTRGISANFMNEVAELAAEKPDFVFNLVESINNKGELNYFVPALLNMYSIPYSGNPLEALFITTSKALSAKILRENNIPTPLTILPSRPDLLKPGCRYIVKPIWEDGSLGITADSVFDFTPDHVERLKGLDDSHWIIQEYIDGREFNISVIGGKSGPEVMPIAEMVFLNFSPDMPRIVDFKAKWIEDSFEYENTIREFPGDNLDPLLAGKINELALSCWKVFGLRGYARVDMRIDENSCPYVIEVNANPCLSPDSGFMAATRKAGMPVTTVLTRILEDINY
ncbi:MAG TPA: ATP-grasp domain-containing protein [Bacteroidales bacterium]|nr:ATP-grasp domain-containing protein [Bacteroidales bacterium]